MKKLFLLAMLILMGSAMFSQSVIYPIATRGTKIGKPIKVGDFVWITSDSTLYQSKVALGRDATGTYLLASRSRYVLGNTTWLGGALAATTGTFSSTLGVTGATTLAGALNAAGTCGFGTSNNKVTIAAATGNTAIAGTLNVTGASVVAALGATTGTFSGTVSVAGALTASVLPTFTIAAGHLTIPNAATGNDTTGVAVAGLTTSAIIVVSYAPTTKALATVASDTAASGLCINTGWLTVAGKHGRVVSYWVPKK